MAEGSDEPADPKKIPFLSRVTPVAMFAGLVPADQTLVGILRRFSCAPRSLHGQTAGMKLSRCPQCHVFQQTEGV